MILAALNKLFTGFAISALFISALAQGKDFTLADWPTTAAPLKPTYVKAIMEQAAIHNVSFSRDAAFYVNALDNFAHLAQEKNYRPYLKTSVAQNLATLAVVHCDWNNGVEPWKFAQKYLGAEQLALLQAHYPEAIAELQKNCE